MQKHVNSEDVVTVKRVSIPTDSYIAGAAEPVRREKVKAVIPLCLLPAGHWACSRPAAHQESPVHAQQPAAIPASVVRASKYARYVRTKAGIHEDTQARLAALSAAALKVQEEFDAAFTWDERKLIAANAYYSKRLSLATDLPPRSMGG